MFEIDILFQLYSDMHVVIVPGNGSTDAASANWYGWAQRKLNEIPGIKCDLQVSWPYLCNKVGFDPYHSLG